jgi:hypothetical protein
MFSKSKCHRRSTRAISHTPVHTAAAKAKYFPALPGSRRSSHQPPSPCLKLSGENTSDSEPGELLKTLSTSLSPSEREAGSASGAGGSVTAVISPESGSGSPLLPLDGSIETFRDPAPHILSKKPPPGQSRPAAKFAGNLRCWLRTCLWPESATPPALPIRFESYTMMA